MLTDKIVWYKGYGIEFDDFGFWTVEYCGDDLVFKTVKEAKDFLRQEGV